MRLIEEKNETNRPIFWKNFLITEYFEFYEYDLYDDILNLQSILFDRNILII